MHDTVNFCFFHVILKVNCSNIIANYIHFIIIAQHVCVCVYTFRLLLYRKVHTRQIYCLFFSWLKCHMVAERITYLSYREMRKMFIRVVIFQTTCKYLRIDGQ